MAPKPHLQLKELGSKLDVLPSSKDALVDLLKQAAPCLTDMDQSPSASVLESMKPFLNSIVKPELLKHQDGDVKLLVATCVCEITRITAPEAPYSDDVLKDIFQLIVSTFSGLSDISGPSFGQEVAMLEILAKYRSCVVMLDLDCDDLVNEMFSTFFAVARDDHPESVLSSMQNIMAVLLEESEVVHENLLSILLSSLGRDKRDVTTAARKLSQNVIQQCIGTLEPSIKQFFLSLVSGESKQVNSQVQFHEVLYDICCCAPQILYGILPYVTGELQTDQLETRLKAVNLVGDIIALPEISTAEAFQPILSEFLKRLTDRDFGVRMSVLDHVKSFLLSNPQRPEAPQIISSLCDRLLDFDENFRKQVVAVICDVACHTLHAVPLGAVNLVAERLQDKSQLVKKYTMERLAEIYRVFCEKSSDTVNPIGYDWIPGKILRCFYDKDFRSDTIESILCGSLFPSEFSIDNMVKHCIDIFSGIDEVEVKALEKLLEQKQRLQEELQKYLALRQNSQDKENPEVQKKIEFCFRVMSRSFANPTEAEESFQILDQLDDTTIWKILTNLVDPNTSFHQTRIYKDDLIKNLGEKHQLNEFLNTLWVKCSYFLFNKEHATAVLSEIIKYKSAENDERMKSCMNMLVIIARFCPHFFNGSEKELVKLLKDNNNNDMIREGILTILAKAGGTIREQLSVTSSSVDLMLERLCLEGSRRQAKYAVHALAAITKDDGLKSLSVLYKRLVDMLEEKTHLPTVLQSLGCIAQTAMPVFETRESEIEEFIINKILKSDSKDDNTKASWDDKSDICVLKIYGIKTVVKSYLPIKGALVRPGIDGLLDILRNILSYGEISKDIKSSSVDKAHLRLASAKAVLRLARLWDHKIPADIFHLTLRASEIGFPQAKKVFLCKIHQYIKERLLEAKYACAFILNIFRTNPNEFAEDKQNLTDIIHMHHQERAEQLSGKSDANSLITYPEYILPYLVHALANLSCPNIDECKDAEAYNTIYRQLHLILSMLVQRDEDVNSKVTSDNEKEILSAITSIFQSIKHSEDVVDPSKSKNSHAICDLGLAITKRLVQKDVDMQGFSHSVSLPPILYKAQEKENDLMASEVKTWLGDESVLAHFESVQLEMVPSQSAEDHALKEDEKDRNEIPLGKIVKKIRSQGTKGKKVEKDKTMTAEPKKAEDDFDILNMVREINLDNLGTSNNFESSNGHESSLSKKVQKDLEFGTIKKRKVGEETLVPVPKRRRSSITHRKSRLGSSSKASQKDSEEVPSGVKLLLDAVITPDTGSKNMQRKLVKGKEPSSEPTIKAFKSYRTDESDKSEEHDIKSPGKLKTTNKTESENFKKSVGSTKRRKRNSTGGLAKCTTKEDQSDAGDLIGCRVKVWWPLDKTFYEGTVQAYDSSKRKHVILYDDGEVEKLCMEKERWEFINEGHKPNKKLKPSKTLPLNEVSTGKKQRSSSGPASKKTTKIVNGKQSPSKYVKHGPKKASKTNFHEGVNESSELSNPEEITISEPETNSGGSEGKQGEGSGVIIAKKKKVNKKLKSGSRGKRPKKKKSLSNKKESNEEKQEPDEEKQDYAERISGDRDSYPQGAQNNEESSSNERDFDESREASRENVDEEESGPEGNQNESDGESSPSREVQTPHNDRTSPDSVGFAELPDDEPLIKWKLPSVKKRSSGKKQ